MKVTRTYTQSKRAEAAAATRRRILDATVALAERKATLEIVLADVAERAGVSVQTVLRHFGTRDALLEAALVHGAEQVAGERETPVGDVDAAVRIIFDHYDRRGDAVIGFLGQERRDGKINEMTTQGRALHREWVRQVFGPLLPDPPDDREATVDLLVVATDVYTWKLLVRDRGLARVDAEARVRRLIHAVLPGGEP
ncbi:TetR/AcrR family transcriptional regulator [Micromonospora sp. NPDC003776]